MRVLVRDVQGVALVVLGVLRIGRTRLHGVGHQPVVGKAQLGNFRGMGERRIDSSLVTVTPVITGVVGHFVMDQRRVALGMGQINHSGQDFVINVDQLGGILGQAGRLGDDQGDLIAHVANLALRQHRVGWLFHRTAVLVVDQPAAGQTAHLGLGQIGTREDVQNPFGRSGPGNVDRFDSCMRMRAAQKVGVTLARQHHVIGVLASAGQKTEILAAKNGFSDRGIRQVSHDRVP